MGYRGYHYTSKGSAMCSYCHTSSNCCQVMSLGNKMWLGNEVGIWLSLKQSVVPRGLRVPSRCGPWQCNEWHYYVEGMVAVKWTEMKKKMQLWPKKQQWMMSEQQSDIIKGLSPHSSLSRIASSPHQPHTISQWQISPPSVLLCRPKKQHFGLNK